MQTINQTLPEKKKQVKEQIAVVSGARGFIGTHLVTALQSRGFKVIAIPRELLYQGKILHEFLKRHQPTYIFHLAAYGNHSNQTDAQQAILTNIGATYALLEASQMFSYDAFINVSTSSVLLPNETFYSATKAAGERICKAFAQIHGKPIISVRPYSVYGESEADFRFIPTVFRSCMTGEGIILAEKATHDWIYVGDFVKEMIDLAEVAGVFQGEIRESGTGIATSNGAVVAAIELITGKKANITNRRQLRSFDNMSWVSKEKLINYTSLAEGLQRYYEYYQQRFKA